ncbi:MAG: hypothetical protein HND59_08230 [Pseudomonadota bacterium]|nr:MAG: hypothetical protein HND59_08230 [Pseudomonadota bacterium]
MSDKESKHPTVEISFEGDFSELLAAFGDGLYGPAGWVEVDEEEQLVKELEKAGKEGRQLVLLAFLLGWIVGG